MVREMTIAGRTISDDADCFVIAEVGHNHQGNIETAKKLIDAAHESGTDAVKLQKRDNRTLFTREYYNRVYNSENSFGEIYGQHREYLEFGRTEYVELKKYAEDLGMVFFATAFDRSSADFLADLDMPAYKIASGDLTNTPLLRYVAEIGKPMIVSTGGGRMEDVERAVEVITETNDELTLLQCTAGYPPEWGELNLSVITTFRERWSEITVGLSSHDSGIAMAVVAYALGARVIEKHFTLNRAMKGTDHAFSLEPQGMRKMVRDLRRARVALGDGQKTPYQSEVEPLIKMAKKLVAARPLEPGHILAEGDIAIKSPGDGLPPYRLSSFVGRQLDCFMAEDEPFHDDVFVE